MALLSAHRARSRATSAVTSPEYPAGSDGPDPGQSGRSGAWTLDEQPGLIRHPICVSSRVRLSVAATDLMSGATALGGIFCAWAAKHLAVRMNAVLSAGSLTG